MKQVFEYFQKRRNKKMFLKIYFGHLYSIHGKPEDAFGNASYDYSRIKKL